MSGPNTRMDFQWDIESSVGFKPLRRYPMGKVEPSSVENSTMGLVIKKRVVSEPDRAVYKQCIELILTDITAAEKFVADNVAEYPLLKRLILGQ